MLNDYLEQLASSEELSPSQTVATTPPPQQPISLSVPRDLSVQIAGSDAGKEKRFRPTATMTKNVTADQVASVEQLMQPFLEDEIKRFHQDRSRKTKSAEVTATPEQAQALKKMCQDYALHLEKRWSRKNQDPRNHRSKQRLDQARKLIGQINQGLGLGDDDGRSFRQQRGEAIDQLERTKDELSVLMCRAQQLIGKGSREDLNAAEIRRWSELHDEINSYLQELGGLDEDHIHTALNATLN
jgi:hypothetical protein